MDSNYWNTDKLQGSFMFHKLTVSPQPILYVRIHAILCIPKTAKMLVSNIHLNQNGSWLCTSARNFLKC